MNGDTPELPVLLPDVLGPNNLYSVQGSKVKKNCHQSSRQVFVVLLRVVKVKYKMKLILCGITLNYDRNIYTPTLTDLAIKSEK